MRHRRHLRTILGFAGTLAGVAALASPPSAGATTGIEATVPVRVTLSDSGVLFSPKLHPDTNTTLVVRVVNRSSSPRTFTFGFRQTPPLKKGGAVLFYYTFHIAGKVPWRSHAAGGKTFAGLTNVSIAKMFSGDGNDAPARARGRPPAVARRTLHIRETPYAHREWRASRPEASSPATGSRG